MLGACALLFGACDDDDTTLIHVPGDEPAAATLSVSSESPLLNMAEDGKSGTIRFKSGGGELQLDLTTNRTNWEYDCDDESWLEVEADEFANTLSLRAARNKATVSPEATLVLTAGSGSDKATVTLRVSQNAAGTPDLDVDEAQVVLPARGELTQEFEFSTNQDEWTFDLNCQWLFVEQTEHSLVLTAEPNADTTARTTQIVVAAGVAPNIVRDTVTVMQEAAAYVIPTPASMGFDDEGGSKTIAVACNYDWDFKVEGDWMTVTREGDVLTVAAGKNTGKDPLEGRQYHDVPVARIAIRLRREQYGVHLQPPGRQERDRSSARRDGELYGRLGRRHERGNDRRRTDPHLRCSRRVRRDRFGRSNRIGIELDEVHHREEKLPRPRKTVG